MTRARDFTKRLQELLRREHLALADFLAVAEFDERRLWVEVGYSSLFDFLHGELRLSKSATFYRQTAVALVRRFPAVADALRDGDLCLMIVAEVARVLTPENVGELLPRFFGLSKRDAKVLVATLLPCEAPAMRAVVTPIRVVPVAPAPALAIPVERAAPVGAADVLPVERLALGHAAVAAQSARRAAPPDAPATAIEPFTAELRRFHVTVTDRLLEKLAAVRAALSHSHPGATDGELLELGLDLLLSRHEERRGLVKKPQKTPRPSANPDHVPAHVMPAVWERDGGKCRWPLASGGLCGSTLRAQLDHVIPRAAGGPSTVENCRVLCQVHNDLAARQFYGSEWMDRFTTGLRARTTMPEGRHRCAPARGGSSAIGVPPHASP